MSDHEEFIRLLQAQSAELRQAGADSNREMMLRLERVMGDKFRMLREERGWSQKELADRVREWGFDFHQSTIAKIERGARPLRVAEMFALSHVFLMPPGAVFFLAYTNVEDQPFDALTRQLARLEEDGRKLREMVNRSVEQAIDVAATNETKVRELVELMRRSAADDPDLASVLAEIDAAHKRPVPELGVPDLLEMGEQVIALVRGDDTGVGGHGESEATS